MLGLGQDFSQVTSPWLRHGSNVIQLNLFDSVLRINARDTAEIEPAADVEEDLIICT